jgi:glutamate-1-semialdehyde 2,1-aminomutase/spore coat polysaccharide biosynthesis protein SpsF
MGEFDEIFFSTTFGGEALSLAAAKATIEEMKRKNVIKHFWKQGARLRDGYNRAAQELGLATECQGLPVHTVMAFKESKEEGEALLRKSLFVQEMAKRGVLCMGTNNVCYSHSDDDMERAVTAAGESLSLLKGAVESRTIPKLLEGKVAKDVFRRPQT